MEYYGIIWNIMESYGIIWNIMEYYGILWNIMESYGILWNIMEYYGIFNGIIWNPISDPYHPILISRMESVCFALQAHTQMTYNI